jgi:hypothetical protein
VLRDPFVAEHQPMASHPSSPRSCGFGRAFLILALGASVHCGIAEAENTNAKPTAGKTAPGKPREEAKKKEKAPAPAERKPQSHVAPSHAPPSHVAPREPKDDAARVQGAPPKSRLPVPPPPDTSAPPPRLPPASREKMHACADEWAKLKLETRGPLRLWRDFAGECLTHGKTNSNQ